MESAKIVLRNFEDVLRFYCLFVKHDIRVIQKFRLGNNIYDVRNHHPSSPLSYNYPDHYDHHRHSHRKETKMKTKMANIRKLKCISKRNYKLTVVSYMYNVINN